MKFEGDFLVGLNRTHEVFVGFSEGIIANRSFALAQVVQILNTFYTKFGDFLKTQEKNALRLKKMENETDEAFFASSIQKEKALHQATFKVQEGAASGQSICEVTSPHRRQEEGKQGRGSGQADGQGRAPHRV